MEEEIQTQRWGHMKTEAETAVSPTLQLGHEEEKAQKQLWWRPPQHCTLDVGRGPYSQSSRRWWGCRPSHLQCTLANSYRRPVQEEGRTGHFTVRSCCADSHSVIIRPVSEAVSRLLTVWQGPREAESGFLSLQPPHPSFFAPQPLPSFMWSPHTLPPHLSFSLGRQCLGHRAGEYVTERGLKTVIFCCCTCISEAQAQEKW